MRAAIGPIHDDRVVRDAELVKLREHGADVLVVIDHDVVVSHRPAWPTLSGPRLGIERVWPLVFIGQFEPTDTILPKRLPSARQWRQGRIRREVEYRRRTEFLPRLQFRARKVRLVGAVGEMLRLKREPLSLAIGRTG